MKTTILFVSTIALSQSVLAETDFSAHWHDGQAELDGYKWSVTRYGETRQGHPCYRDGVSTAKPRVGVRGQCQTTARRRVPSPAKAGGRESARGRMKPGDCGCQARKLVRAVRREAPPTCASRE